jgi:hypothetical protein
MSQQYLNFCYFVFGFGVALFFIGIGVIPAPRDETLVWFKWGGALLALCTCGAYAYRKQRASVEPKSPQRPAE